jgi:hypothetical protein
MSTWIAIANLARITDSESTKNQSQSELKRSNDKCKQDNTTTHQEKSHLTRLGLHNGDKQQKATGGVCACGLGSKLSEQVAQTCAFGKQEAQYGKEPAKSPPRRFRTTGFVINIGFPLPPCCSFAKARSRLSRHG